MKRWVIIFFTAASYFSISSAYADFTKFYLTEDITSAGNILSAVIDGTGLSTVPVSPSEPDRIAIDSLHGKIYWSEPINNRILRADLDGSNIQTIVTITGVFGIALDANAGVLYYSHGVSSRAINKANLDGSSATTIVVTGETTSKIDIAFDVSTQKLFWAEPTNDIIKIANADGTSSTNIVSLGSTAFIDAIAIDEDNDRIYWIDNGNFNISSSNFTGASPTLITSYSSVVLPKGLAIDGLNGPAVFWTESAGIRVNRYDVQGSSNQVLLTSIDGLVKPTGIALLFEQNTPTPVPTPPAEVVPTPPVLTVDPTANEVVATFESYTIDFFFPDGFGNSIQGIGSPSVRYSSTARRSDGVTRRVVSKNNQARFRLPSRSLGASAADSWTIDYRALAVIKRKPSRREAAISKLSQRIKDLKKELFSLDPDDEATRIDIQNQIQTARAKKALAKTRTLIKTQKSDPSSPFTID